MAWPPRRCARCTACNAWSTWARRTWRASPSMCAACACWARRCAQIHTGTATLKDAMNEALRDWIANVADTYYLLGTGAGPHPYPWLVREFQRVIGDETREQILADRAPAGCHGRLRRRRFERAGLLLSLPGRRGRADDRRGSGRAGPGQRRSRGQPGAGCPACCTAATAITCRTRTARSSTRIRSRRAWTTGRGAEHALLHDRKRVDYVSVTDAQAVSAFHWLTRRQGILPALGAMRWLMRANSRPHAARRHPDRVPERARRQEPGHRYPI